MQHRQKRLRATYDGIRLELRVVRVHCSKRGPNSRPARALHRFPVRRDKTWRQTQNRSNSLRAGRDVYRASLSSETIRVLTVAYETCLVARHFTNDTGMTSEMDGILKVETRPALIGVSAMQCALMSALPHRPNLILTCQCRFVFEDCSGSGKRGPVRRNICKGFRGLPGRK
jgi:hypothetical protein